MESACNRLLKVLLGSGGNGGYWVVLGIPGVLWGTVGYCWVLQHTGYWIQDTLGYGEQGTLGYTTTGYTVTLYPANIAGYCMGMYCWVWYRGYCGVRPGTAGYCRVLRGTRGPSTRVLPKYHPVFRSTHNYPQVPISALVSPITP